MSQAKPENSAKRKTFEELAREIGCDEDENRFEETVKRVAKAPPEREDTPAKD